MPSRILILAGLCAAVGLLATACGSSSPSAEEEWAGKVCTPISDWQGKMTNTVDDVQSELKSPSLQTPAAVRSSVNKGINDTKQLVSDLKGLPAPPAEADNGQKASEVLTGLKDSLTKTVDNVQGQVKSAGSNPSLNAAAASISEI